MSRSNNEMLVNPAKRFFEYSGDKGTFYYYDKVKKEKVEVNLPFQFMVLEILATITGWNDAEQCNMYSNEVKDLSTQVITVKTSKTSSEIAKGLYADIKDKIQANGGNYAASVYIAFKEEDSLEIGHIKIKGAALGSWIDYGKKHGFYKDSIAIKSTIEGKKGKTIFKIPVFEQAEISLETDAFCKELDKELQDYLLKYFLRNKQNIAEKEIESQAEEAQVQDGLPF